MNDPQPTTASDAKTSLTLPQDEGLSLENLSKAYADAIQGGDDPYQSTKNLSLAAEPVHSESETLVNDEEVSPRSILEAILFVGHPHNEPQTSKQIASLMRGVRSQEIDELVVELNKQYADDGSAYVIKSVSAGYRLTLRDEYISLREKFYGRVKEARLSQTSIDTLAMVAYHQPITRQQIELYRGKSSSNVLRQLVRRDLLCVERNEEKPRVPFYRTTDRFLELFGLEDLDDLPKSQELD